MNGIFLAVVGATGVACATGLGLRIRSFRRHYFGPPLGHSFIFADLEDVFSQEVKHYYVHGSGRHAEAIEAGLYCHPPFDADGVPVVRYVDGIHHNPYTVALYASENWEAYLRTGEQDRAANFLKQAQWLMSHHQEGRWFYRFDYEPAARDMRGPWISALCQGMGISVLLRAWQFSGSAAYRRVAEQALEPFSIPIRRGGVADRTEEGTWFEEFPQPRAPSHVLNGHIWAMFGLWDLWRATRNDRSRQLFDEGCAVLKAHLDDFDTGFWVLYDLLPRSTPVSSSYMHFQIEQLRVLAAITGDQSFQERALRWRGYHESWQSALRLALRQGSGRIARLILRNGARSTGRRQTGGEGQPVVNVPSDR